MDIFSKDKRSRIMSHVGGKDTKPEQIVRSLLHRMGYRFRLHRKDLPGKPDIVLPKYKKVIFVHGCFWHGHSGCKRAKRPATNQKFWHEKLDKNIARDRAVIEQLEKMGWKVLVVWTCEMKDMESLQMKLSSFIAA